MCYDSVPQFCLLAYLLKKNAPIGTICDTMWFNSPKRNTQKCTVPLIIGYAHAHTHSKPVLIISEVSLVTVYPYFDNVLPICCAAHHSHSNMTSQSYVKWGSVSISQNCVRSGCPQGHSSTLRVYRWGKVRGCTGWHAPFYIFLFFTILNLLCVVEQLFKGADRNLMSNVFLNLDFCQNLKCSLLFFCCALKHVTFSYSTQSPRCVL